jgi:SAM-dependent methyltransferase
MSNAPARPAQSTTGTPIVCPVCHASLTASGDFIECQGCSRRFEVVGGFPDLVVGGRFEDEYVEEWKGYEEETNVDTMTNYWIPLFQKLTPSDGAPARILSVGCGTGIDVDLLHDRGYEAVGIDCGNRSRSWPRRQRKDRLFMANGMQLPFEDASFDVAFCGCVFPHVGVEGDSFRVTPRFHEDRLQMAREMSRVVKPGGKIVVSSPNRRFPCDIFHGREAGGYKVRPYWPGDPFLLSISDYRKLFREAGRGRAVALPVEGYWGFMRSKKNWKGRLLGMPVRFLFWLVSREQLAFLRGSPLSPWIVVLVESDR